jgi:hypothetical protein
VFEQGFGSSLSQQVKIPVIDLPSTLRARESEIHRVQLSVFLLPPSISLIFAFENYFLLE